MPSIKVLHVHSFMLQILEELLRDFQTDTRHESKVAIVHGFKRK